MWAGLIFAGIVVAGAGLAWKLTAEDGKAHPSTTSSAKAAGRDSSERSEPHERETKRDAIAKPDPEESAKSVAERIVGRVTPKAKHVGMVLCEKCWGSGKVSLNRTCCAMATAQAIEKIMLIADGKEHLGERVREEDMRRQFQQFYDDLYSQWLNYFIALGMPRDTLMDESPCEKCGGTGEVDAGAK